MSQDILLLRFDAPMMSFGTVAVDNIRRTAAFPGRSMLAGLFGNALGYMHLETDALQRLQSRIRHAVRQDRGGHVRTDFQTVDLGQPFLRDDLAWTSWGKLDRRGSGKASTETHIRYKDYLMDSAFTVAVTLTPDDEEPTLDDLEEVLRRPCRPLFLGRKCCIPAAPLVSGRVRAKSLLDALQKHPTEGDPRRAVWWPEGEDKAREQRSHQIVITDERDWRNQIHVGSYPMYMDREDVPTHG